MPTGGSRWGCCSGARPTHLSGAKDEPLARRLGVDHGAHVRLSHIAHIHSVHEHVDEAGHFSENDLLDQVQAGTRGAREHRALDQARVDSRELELAPLGLRLDDVPCCVMQVRRNGSVAMEASARKPQYGARHTGNAAPHTKRLWTGNTDGKTHLPAPRASCSPRTPRPPERPRRSSPRASTPWSPCPPCGRRRWPRRRR